MYVDILDGFESRQWSEYAYSLISKDNMNGFKLQKQEKPIIF